MTHLSAMTSPTPTHITWSYGQYQPWFESWKERASFVNGLPDLDTIKWDSLVVIDDQMAETNLEVANMFTKDSHHRNYSLIYIVQNIFGKNPHMRTISLNAHYIVLFKNPRDASQASHLGKQMYPNRLQYFNAAYKEATAPPHGYLLCDLRQETPEHMRLRTDIFPDDARRHVFVEDPSCRRV